MSIVAQLIELKNCSASFVMAVDDTKNVMEGKWKLKIIALLLFGKKRFTEMQREIPKINPRMLSKELRDLESNGMVNRTVYSTVPVTVEYELTDSGKSFHKVLDAMIEWGIEHRSNVLGPRK